MSWKIRMILKLKRNWLVALKLTWGTSQILTRALENQKTFLFQLFPCDQSIYCVSYKSTEELSFMTLMSYANFEEKLTSALKKDYFSSKKGKFSSGHLKVSKLELWWDLFVQSGKGMTLKFTEELCHDNEEQCKIE